MRLAADPCTFVVFGASGDLFRRMVMPALFDLFVDGELPERFDVLCLARSELREDAFRERCREALLQYSRQCERVGASWDGFARRIRYVNGAYDDPAQYDRIIALLAENQTERGTGDNRLFLLLTPPNVFAPIVTCLAQAELGPERQRRGWTRLIVEKPFGSDLTSARALQHTIAAAFGERDVYRMDHYLAKEPVQDIMAVRFANPVFAEVWNARTIDCVLITAAESLGVEGRGGYYDGAGALRDMIQNHALNLLALVAMEQPTSTSAAAIRDEKTRALAAIHPLALGDIADVAVRGQYGAGTIDGRPVVAYRDEPDVDPESNTETYAALRLTVDNARWSGVPFFVRSGKRLRAKSSKIAIRFKADPRSMFGGAPLDQNVLVIDVHPHEGIAFRFSTHVPGSNTRVRQASMDFSYRDARTPSSRRAYERLLLDAVHGDATLFTRWDAVETAWERMMPVLDYWHGAPAPFPNYAAGSQGPRAADALLALDGRRWWPIG